MPNLTMTSLRADRPDDRDPLNDRPIPIGNHRLIPMTIHNAFRRSPSPGWDAAHRPPRITCANAPKCAPTTASKTTAPPRSPPRRPPAQPTAPLLPRLFSLVSLSVLPTSSVSLLRLASTL